MEKSDFQKKYEIIASRTKNSDLKFYYGVKTTGIFCSPGCSSRLPKPENVLFFDTPREAMEKGFRPCKKCRPLDKEGTDSRSHLVGEICRIIEGSEETPTLKFLADKTGYSESYIQRMFKKATSISPKDYSRAVKSERFRKEVGNSSSITSSIYSAGYGSPSRIYENLDSILAMSPTQSQNGGKGLEIRRGVFTCFLGFVLIAFTDKGVSSIEIGDRESDLNDDFRERYKNAQIGPLSEGDRLSVKAILEKMENPLMEVTVPLDIQGTIFQCKVWKALRNIPPGTTKSYSEIAEEIGRPKSVRAVANACGKNKIAVLVPCHRVIGKNGAIGGYRWGVERKNELLNREKG